MTPSWRVEDLASEAAGVSVSRRTDIPALYGRWFWRRLQEGFAEYVPMGPPRRLRRSLLPRDVTHFNFWSKWPRPFLGPLERVLNIGYPVLWNVTITGHGGTSVEPNTPPSARVVEAVRQLACLVPAAAIQWRFDPLLLTRDLDARHYYETFARLAGELAHSVDRVAVSLPTLYIRQVLPDLRAWAAEQNDELVELTPRASIDFIGRLAELATAAGLQLVTCCAGAEVQPLGLPAAGCNSFDWARRVYPELQSFRQLRKRPCRSGCTCSEETDIGAYDTCILGCRYSYGSCNERRALQNHARHDPSHPCLIP